MSVYFAQVGHYIKIGYSENPERRVRNLMASETRYSAPWDCPLDRASRHLIRYIEGDKDTEFEVHRALRDFQVGTEWFADEPEVREFIAAATYREDGYDRVTRPGGPLEWVHRPMTNEEAALLTAALEHSLSSLADTA